MIDGNGPALRGRPRHLKMLGGPHDQQALIEQHDGPASAAPEGVETALAPTTKAAGSVGGAVVAAALHDRGLHHQPPLQPVVTPRPTAPGEYS